MTAGTPEPLRCKCGQLVADDDELLAHVNSIHAEPDPRLDRRVGYSDDDELPLTPIEMLWECGICEARISSAPGVVAAHLDDSHNIRWPKLRQPRGSVAEPEPTPDPQDLIDALTVMMTTHDGRSIDAWSERTLRQARVELVAARRALDAVLAVPPSSAPGNNWDPIWAMGYDKALSRVRAALGVVGNPTAPSKCVCGTNQIYGSCDHTRVAETETPR